MSLRRSRIIRGRDKRYKLRTRDCQPVKSTHAEIPRPLLLIEFAEFPRDTIEKPTKRALRSRVQVFFFLIRTCECYSLAIGLFIERDCASRGLSRRFLVVDLDRIEYKRHADVSLGRRMMRGYYI